MRSLLTACAKSPVSLATILVVLSAGAALAQEPTFAIGHAGWVLEHFGTDVTVIRSATDPANSQAAALLLSCEGIIRRLRLTLPTDIAGRNNTAGVVLVRKAAVRASKDIGFGTPFILSANRTLLISDSRAKPENAVAAFAQILAERPPAIELLLHVGPRPIVLPGLIPYRLALFASSNDGALFLDFVNRCEPTPRSGAR